MKPETERDLAEDTGGADAPSAEGAATEGTAASGDAAGQPAAGAAPATGEEALRAERDDLFGRLQRLSAEFDNFQKRVKREKTKWTADTLRDVLTGFLPVMDNIQYAVAAFDQDVKDPASLRRGVEMVRDELLNQLAARNVTPIAPDPGTPFDIEQHQAIHAEPVEGLEREEVSYLARPGYRMGDVVLRPAQVAVKKPAAK